MNKARLTKYVVVNRDDGDTCTVWTDASKDMARLLASRKTGWPRVRLVATRCCETMEVTRG